MSNPIDRLRTHLRAAAIPATDADLEGIQARGFLSRLADFERIVAGVPAETLPDYAASPAPLDPLPPPDPPELPATPDPSGTSVLDAAAAIRAGATSPTALLEAALARIDALIHEAARLLQPLPELPPGATLFERMRARRTAASLTPTQRDALVAWAAMLADLRTQLAELMED